jgi:hypothetical protein
MRAKDGGGSFYTTDLSSSEVYDGNWHHIIGLADVNKLGIYLDGNLETSLTTSTSSPNLAISRPLSIGNSTRRTTLIS